MERAAKKVPPTLIAAASLLFLLLSALLVLLILNPRDRETRFLEALESAGTAVEQGGGDRLLRQAGQLAFKSGHWKSLLYLSLQYSEKQDEWSLLRDLSKKAMRKYPGREDFRGVYTGALLWNGEPEKALDASLRLSSPEFSGLKAEIFLVQESLRINPDIQPYQGVLEALKSTKDAEYYEKIARITGNQPLLADAAMLWLELGELDRAYEMTRNLSHKDVPDQIPGYIAYDWGDLELAQTYLTSQMLVDRSNYNERWTLNALLGDISFQLGQWSEAEQYYRRAMEIHGDGHWRTRLNLSVLYDLREIRKVSKNLMEETLAEYPDTSEVISHFVYYWRDTYPVVSQRLLEQYLERHPDNLLMQLNQLRYFPREMSPEEYNAFLWSLFNQDSGNKEIARFLLNFLMAQNDFEGALLVLERYRRSSRDTHWTAAYEGVMMALRSPGGLSNALDTLEESLGRRAEWYVYFNQAVLKLRSGDSPGALEALNHAEEKIEEVQMPDNPQLEGKISALYGRIYLTMGDRIKARNYALEGLEWDRNNLEARSILLELKE